VLDALSAILPDITGVRGRNSVFWQILLCHHVVTLCGIVEDIFVRQKSLSEREYVIGVPNDKLQFVTPASWSESIDLISNNDKFRCFMASILLGKSYEKKEKVSYNFFKAYRITENSSRIDQIKARLKHFLKNPHKLSNIILKIYYKWLGSFFSNKDKVRALIWDNPALFYSLPMDNFVFRNVLIKKNKSSILQEKISVDKVIREKIKKAVPSPIGEFLAYTLPICCIEGLQQIVEEVNIKSLKKFKNIERIYSHGHIIAEYDFWRVAAALLADRGLNIYFVQHGGALNYYSHPSFLMEGGLAGEFISWGLDSWHVWHKKSFLHKPPRPMPSLYLGQLKKNKGKIIKRTVKKKWKALFLVFAENKWIKWLYNPLFPDLACDYFKREKTLFDFFENQKDSAIKVFSIEYGWYHKDWIETKYPSLHCIVGSKNFIDFIPEAEIIIVDYNATGFLEVLVLEVPFLATWDRRWWRGNEVFEKCLNMLEEAGIFYEDPKELIEDYENIICKDINAWWDQRKIDVVREVAKHIALTSETAYKEWYDELSK
jgi:putative transferase (TIGR04331 family)